MSTAPARAAHTVAAFLARFVRGLWTRPWLLLAVPLAALAYVMALIPFTPSIVDIRKAKAEQPSVALTADGQELAVFRRANREWVKLGDMAPSVLTALIATEDHRFYEHRGVDVRRTASAVVHTLTGRLQGGSTLTQQLARNLYPEEIGRAATVSRKIKEAITALKIESVYTKEEILETYLNTVPFLYNAYGIEMAARTYFDKRAGELDVLESATLVGMLKGTSYYNPVLNPDRALQRRNIVLGQMAKHGKLEVAQLEALKKRPLRLDFERQQEQLGPAPHFAKHLRRWLIDWADRQGYNIYADGLVVRTTIDSRLQNLATQALARQADRLQQSANAAWGPRSGWGAQRELVQAFVRESAEFQSQRAAGLGEEQALRKLLSDAAFVQTLREDKTRLQAGFMAMEPGTGLVRAWVGSRDFSLDQFDHVQQARRQPGSTFKPFVYGAAFEQGARAGDTLLDEVKEFRLGNGQVWRPTDASAPTGQLMTLREGLAQSRNTITAQVMHAVGPQRVAQLAQALGVRESKLDQVPSLALGTSPVTLREMVAAYAAIAHGGAYVPPQIVARVEDRSGRVLEEFMAPQPEQAMSPASALVLLDVLRGAIDRGTGTAIRTRYGIQADVAGKTGTTQDNTDGWFVLMHPQLVAGAWVGFNDSRITMQDSWGPGARSALPMVGEFFQQSLRMKAIDAKARFGTPPPEPGVLDPLIGQVNDWWGRLFPAAAPNGNPAVTAAPAPGAAPPRQADGEAVVTVPAPPSEPAVVTIPAPRAAEQAIVIAPPRQAEPAIVIAPPRASPPVVLTPGAQPAIVVAPPRAATGSAQDLDGAVAGPGSAQ
jgi:penicillin-binding protein 1A